LSFAQSKHQGPAVSGAFRCPGNDGARLLGLVFALLLAGLTATPLISLVNIAAGGDSEIWPHLASFVLPQALVETAVLLLGVAAVACTAGTGTAWLVTTYQFPGRAMLLWLLPLPLATPTYIAAYVYADLLDAAGPVQSALRQVFGWASPNDYWFPPVRSLGGAVLIFGLVLYPYVYLAARAMFQTQSASFTEMARVLGARPIRLVRDIALPLSRPALAVGIALALVETLNDLGASEYLGVQTLTIAVFTTWLNRGSLAGAAQIAIVMLVIVIILITLERRGRARQGYAVPAQDTGLMRRAALTGRSQWLAFIACFTPVALGFLIPVAFLLRETLRRDLLSSIGTELAGPLLNTAMLAGCATILVLMLGAAAATVERVGKSAVISASIAVAAMGYAVPGTILALGLLAPLVAVDNAINAASMQLTGTRVGLVLAGSSAAVVIAYVVRFLAIAVGLSQAGLRRIPGEYEDAARSLGARRVTVARDLYLPLARPALWGAALLVFVDCLKELPATLLLRPLNTDTLATYVYQFATRGSFEDGALAALLIVLVGIFAVAWLVRFAERTPRPYAAPRQQ
jgi:iron(III) transport system permease protein